MNEVDGSARRWCILRTSGGRTLALATSLAAAGVEAWTPRRTLKRPMPGRRPKSGEKPPMIEVDAPILPTYVFARAVHLPALLAILANPTSPHPAFSIFRDAGRIPEIAERSVSGLQDAEREALEYIAAIREADTRDEQRRIHAAAMRTERERRKAMRQQFREFTNGQSVTVEHMPALAGMSGVVMSSDGHSAVVAFGGALTMTIEAWRLESDIVQASTS